MRLSALALMLLGCAGDPLYGPCETAGDCAEPADGCYELRYRRTDGSEAQGRTCTNGCAADADCAGEARCLALVGDASETFLCYQRCLSPMDCLEGHACTRITLGGDAVCLPQ